MTVFSFWARVTEVIQVSLMYFVPFTETAWSVHCGEIEAVAWQLGQAELFKVRNWLQQFRLLVFCRL
jgi:hypothetical protein